MKTTVHTPLPWVLVPGSSDIANEEENGYWNVASANRLRDEWKANAALIVHRVNTWETLVDALEQAHNFFTNTMHWNNDDGMVNACSAALNAAKEVK